MLHLSVSTVLADRFATLLVAKPKQVLGGDRWFAHLVPVSKGEMMLLLESKSRYCLVFYYPGEVSCSQFQAKLVERLSREVVAVCQLDSQQAAKMSKLIRAECQIMQFGIGLDYDISADMYDAARHLQSIVEDLGGYPVVGISEFSLGVKLNQVPLDEKDVLSTPLRQFSKQWHLRLQQQESSDKQNFAPNDWPDNVVPIGTVADKP